MEYQNVIGIVGGMGPASGVLLCNQLIRLTEANTDQEHYPFVLMSFPGKLVDRSAFLLGATEENPAFAILDIIDKLEQAGANIIGIPCNTSHSPEIFDVISNAVSRSNKNLRLVHMPLETCKTLQKKVPKPAKVGVLSTNGTFRSGVYKKMLQQMGYEVVMPDTDFQHEVIHRIVYDPVFGIKANSGRLQPEAAKLLHVALDFFQQQQAQTVILGCTEFSLVDMPHRKTLDFIDSTRCLAKALLREAAILYNAGSNTVNNFK